MESNYLWITAGGGGLAVAREVAKSVPTLCWGDFVIHGEDGLLPQYIIWDKINHWMQERNSSPKDYHIIIDGFIPFVQPHVLNGKTHRNTADFLPAVGGGNSAKLFHHLGSNPLLARAVAQQHEVPTVPIVQCDSLKELLDYLQSEPTKPHDIAVGEKLHRSKSGASAYKWMSELSLRNRLESPFSVSTPPDGKRVRVLQLFSNGKSISGPVLDCGGSMCAIGQGSLIYIETLKKMHGFLEEINWTGVFGMDVLAAKVDEDFHIYGEGIVAEFKHANLPALSELHSDEPADMIRSIVQGEPVRWRSDWVSSYNIIGDAEPRLQPVWNEDGISKKARVWWGDVIEDHSIRRLTGKLVAVLTARHGRDPRKAQSNLDRAFEFLVAPEFKLFIEDRNADSFRTFSQLINWELCMSLKKEAKSATNNTGGKKRKGTKKAFKNCAPNAGEDLQDLESAPSENKNNG